MLTYILYTGIFIVLLIMVLLYIRYGRAEVPETLEDTQAEQTLAEFDQEIDKILNDPNLTELEKQQRADECIHRYGMNAQL